MIIHTIGFTKKSAERFFGLLSASQATKLIDVRLNNVSQLAGFAKRDDLKFFLKTIRGMDYVHCPELAPTQEMVDSCKKRGSTTWAEYESQFLDLMAKRRVEVTVPRDLVDNTVLLCSEDKPHHCHRRLVADYLTRQWGDVAVNHLV
jgi:uncharacterized protein (DUF488 family)